MISATVSALSGSESTDKSALIKERRTTGGPPAGEHDGVDPRDWPLSAVATELLLQRLVARQRWAVLTLKELVVSGVWSVAVVEQPRLIVGVRRTTVLRPGTAPLPDRPPLAVLDRWLRARVGAEAELRTVGQDLQRESRLAHAGLGAATDDLLARGLVAPATTLLGRSTVRPTPLGHAQADRLAAQRSAWKDALRPGGAAAEQALAELGGSPGLVVLLERGRVRDVDRALRAGADTGGGTVWSDLSSLDGVGGLGGLDSAFDSGGFDSSGSDVGGSDAGGSDAGGGDSGG